MLCPCAPEDVARVCLRREYVQTGPDQTVISVMAQDVVSVTGWSPDFGYAGNRFSNRETRRIRAGCAVVLTPRHGILSTARALENMLCGVQASMLS